MKKTIEMLKEWYKLAEPSKKEFIFQCILTAIIVTLLVLSPIPSAKVITNLTKDKFNIAILFAILFFLIETGRQFFWHLFFMSTARSIKHTYLKVQDKIYNKALNAKDSEFKKMSKEKLLNIIGSDIYTVAEASRFFSQRLGTIIRVIVTIIVVLCINIYVGLFVIFMTYVNFRLINHINKKKAYWMQKRLESKDRIFEEFTEILDTKKLVKNLDVKDKLKKRYDKATHKYVAEIKKKEWFWASMDENWYYGFYMMVAQVAAVFLIFLISQKAIDLALYLIVVPYIREIMKETRVAMKIFVRINNASISTNRINTFLNFTDSEMIEFGKNENDDILGNIEFNNVSYENKDQSDQAHGRVSELTFNIQKGAITLIKGQTQSGKRQIFYLLNRYIKQDSGNILLDGASIFEYSELVYKSNVNYVTYKPTFFSGSILDNFKMVEKSKEEIIKICKRVGVHEFIKELPKGYKTNLIENLKLIPKDKQFLIALARTLMTKSEVILIYEFPTTLQGKSLERIKKILASLRGERTIIIFSATDVASDICNNTVKISRGKIGRQIRNKEPLY